MTNKAKLPFDKPFKTLDKQIELLKNRGMIIENEANALLHLKHINYYHLAIYAKFFQRSDESFRSGTTFDQVLRLYQFDKKLRELLLDVLERIELSLKCAISYDISFSREKDIYWFADVSNFIFQKPSDKKVLEDIYAIVRNSRESYIQHFYSNYSDSGYPPVWIFFEPLSFGECVKFLSMLTPGNQQVVSKKYSLPYGLNLGWMLALKLLRNICAHHSRLWNRQFTFKIRQQHPKYGGLFSDIESNSLYSYLIVLQIYLAKISPTSSWKERLKQLIEDYQIPIDKMGFPADWHQRLSSVLKG